jgi:hypothetical protein
MKYAKNRRWLIMALFLIGSLASMSAWVAAGLQTAQNLYYELGRMAYIVGDNQTAANDFQLSYADYSDRLTSNLGPAQAPPALEQAELSQEHLALSEVKMKQGKLAVIAYKSCLLLTSDEYLSYHSNLISPGVSDPSQLATAYAKIKADGKDCKIALEILYNNQPALSQAEGIGQGQGQGSGDQTSEDPSNNAGTLNRNKVND